MDNGADNIRFPKPLRAGDSNDWSYNVRHDLLRIGRMTATRDQWIEAIRLLDRPLGGRDA